MLGSNNSVEIDVKVETASSFRPPATISTLKMIPKIKFLKSQRIGGSCRILCYPVSFRNITGASMLRSLILHVGKVLYPPLDTIHSHIIKNSYLRIATPS